MILHKFLKFAFGTTHTFFAEFSLIMSQEQKHVSEELN